MNQTSIMAIALFPESANPNYCPIDEKNINNREREQYSSRTCSAFESGNQSRMHVKNAISTKLSVILKYVRILVGASLLFSGDKLHQRLSQ